MRSRDRQGSATPASVMTPNPVTDDSVLHLFDPLASSGTSPVLTRARERFADPHSPVAAFFNTLDRSNQLLATAKKRKEHDLIDLAKTPVQSQARNRDHERNNMAPVFDPFSPPAPAPAFRTVPHLILDDQFHATPAKPNPDLLVSTNVTPVPINLPYLPNASLSSLYTSSTSSSSTSRRRRSSIDLDKQLGQAKSPSSSFDILRGELEIGTSAEASFVSTVASESSRTVDSAIEESPWTIRNVEINCGDCLVGSLMPVQETTEGSLLAHEIPLPDSPPTSPESSPLRNVDAELDAPKIFPNSRRFSLAPTTLDFPQASDEPSPSHTISNPSTCKPAAHTRTISMASVNSVGSSKSTVTVRNTSPSRRPNLINKERRETILPGKSKINTSSKLNHTAISKQNSGNRRSTLLPAPQKPSPHASPSKRVPRASIAMHTTSSKMSLLGNGARPSIVPPTARPRASIAPTHAPRTSIAPPSVRGSIAPRSSIGPRASIASNLSTAKPRAGRTSMAPPPVPTKRAVPPANPRHHTKTNSSTTLAPNPNPNPAAPTKPIITTTGSAGLEGGGTTARTALTTGTRANTRLNTNTGANTNVGGAPRRVPRPSMGSTAFGGGRKAVGDGGSGVRPLSLGAKTGRPSLLPTTAAGADNSIKRENDENAISVDTAREESDEEDYAAVEGVKRGLRRPRTSSAGAALISRPSVAGGTGGVGIGPRPATSARLQRPKSVFNFSRV